MFGYHVKYEIILNSLKSEPDFCLAFSVCLDKFLPGRGPSEARFFSPFCSLSAIFDSCLAVGAVKNKRPMSNIAHLRNSSDQCKHLHKALIMPLH